MTAAPLSPALRARAAGTVADCVACGRCQQDCAFLQRHGNPGELAAALLGAAGGDPAAAFGCSLCGLCDAVCPKGIAVSDLFRGMREEAVARDPGHLKPYGALRRYETLGISRLFSHRALPERCDTVLFPGCALPGTRPSPLWEMYQHLRRQIPQLGLVLDCCTKPSHDLGDRKRFRRRFGRLLDHLIERGVRRVLVACPNCLRVFREHGSPLEVETVYEVLARGTLPAVGRASGVAAIHDPCVARFDRHVHGAVRALARACGLTIEEMPRHGESAVCCGEGGAVAFHEPELADAWTGLRVREAGDRPLLTYCSGCTEQLGRRTPTMHLLDLLFGAAPGATAASAPVHPLVRYWNRLQLARRARREIRSPNDH